MREWTEQEEQEMIERAKQGDPKANYELSLWALRRAEEEPEEARWNRLAAKCLVKAAKAGYGPAQVRMAQVLHQSQAQEQPAPSRTQEPPSPSRQPVRLSDARAARRSQGPAPESTARRPEPPQTSFEPDEDGEEAPRGRAGGRGAKPRPLYDRRDDEPESYDDELGGEAPSAPRWGEKQWRRVEFICIAVCAVLLVLIAVMIITSRGGGSEPVNPTVPVAGDANTTTTASTSPSPEPESYPDADTLKAIAAAELEVYPEDSDYVSVPTTATVKVDSQTLRLRTGPSTTYVPPICNMEDGTEVDVFAIKNNWSLVLYKDGEDGPVYGWCSSEYLIVTSGAADNSSVG